jgi:site-specific DNA-methyltransferase (adenine-specific)
MNINTDHNPDVLNCLANLSSDEVFSPPGLVNEMLDQLPKALWKNKNATFLDPFCKSGVFLREITKRLLKGLETEIPDLQERANHIFTKQVFGIAITDLTALMARRSLYCTKEANNKYSACTEFKNPDGNIRYVGVKHTWVRGNCQYCSASQKEYDRIEGKDTHAYEFIHVNSPGKIFNMKFDVIIGNPPYQLSDAGDSTGSSPIYQHFVEQAKKLNPRYLSMIIPSRWFAGGKGLEEFRNTMLKDRRIIRLVDYPVAGDVFPGVKIIGGVCYFLWSRDAKADCKVTTSMGGKIDTMERPLDQFPTFVRFNKAVSILEKIQSKGHSSMVSQVTTQKPFGLRTFERPTGKGTITLFANKSIGKIEKKDILTGHNLISKWKVLLSKGYGEGGETREYPRRILGKPIVTPPNSACTETYIVVGAYDSEEQANNLAIFLRTKLARFLVGLMKNTQDLSKEKFGFVPSLPMTKTWGEEELNKYFGITSEEIEFIDTIIRPIDELI